MLSGSAWGVNALAWAAAAGASGALGVKGAAAKPRVTELAWADGAAKDSTTTAQLIVMVFFLAGWVLCNVVAVVSAFLAPL